MSALRPKTETSRKRPLGRTGQATVEFVLTLVLFLGFALFYIQNALMMGWANYIHYATFMSARAQLSAGPTPQDQALRAKTVATRMLKRESGKDRFPSLGQGVDGDDPEVAGLFIEPPEQFTAAPGNPAFSWLEGVRYRFKTRLFRLPLLGAAPSRGPASELELQSESWLGRDPSDQECMNYMKTVKGTLDNGC